MRTHPRAGRGQPADPPHGPLRGAGAAGTGAGARRGLTAPSATDPRWHLRAVGHEIRTPLAVVKGAAETALAHADELDGAGLEQLLRTIVRNSDLALLSVDGDPTALREIVFNVLSNAAKYSAPGAPIEVTVRAGDENAEVVIRDHGSGVTSGDSQTIFDKFVQGDADAPGVGLACTSPEAWPAHTAATCACSRRTPPAASSS